MQKIGIFLIILCFALTHSFPAHAYIDPGSGSLISQLILAVLFGSMFYARKIWCLISTSVKKLRYRSKNSSIK